MGDLDWGYWDTHLHTHTNLQLWALSNLFKSHFSVLFCHIQWQIDFRSYITLTQIYNILKIAQLSFKLENCGNLEPKNSSYIWRMFFIYVIDMNKHEHRSRGSYTRLRNGFEKKIEKEKSVGHIRFRWKCHALQRSLARWDTSGATLQAHIFLLSWKMDTCRAEPQRSGWKQDLASLKHLPPIRKAQLKTQCHAEPLICWGKSERGERGRVTGRASRAQRGTQPGCKKKKRKKEKNTGP